MIRNSASSAQQEPRLTLSRAKVRNCHAGTIAEFGPALFILLILIFFPVLDLLSICFSYGVVKLLNQNQVHEASLIEAKQANDPAGIIKKGIPDQWQQAGFGKFVNVAGRVQTDVSYRDGLASEGKATEKFVIVKTTVVCNPLVFVPFPIAKIPGLNTPVPMVATSECPMENPENAG